MMLTRSRARSIGWAMILAVCFALTVALTFKVNAVKSEVRLTERRIAALKAEKSLLETEFETRANQQQLTALNDVEFGYQAPTAGQYLESERQLAALGVPRGPGAPDMIRVAAAEPGVGSRGANSVFPAMVNPLTGKALAAETPAEPHRAVKVTPIAAPGGLVERLSHVERQPRPIKAGAIKTAALKAGGKTRVSLAE